MAFLMSARVRAFSSTVDVDKQEQQSENNRHQQLSVLASMQSNFDRSLLRTGLFTPF
jgi:hypothetical protein